MKRLALFSTALALVACAGGPLTTGSHPWKDVHASCRVESAGEAAVVVVRLTIENETATLGPGDKLVVKRGADPVSLSVFDANTTTTGDETRVDRAYETTAPGGSSVSIGVQRDAEPPRWATIPLPEMVPVVSHGETFLFTRPGNSEKPPPGLLASVVVVCASSGQLETFASSTGSSMPLDLDQLAFSGRRGERLRLEQLPECERRELFLVQTSSVRLSDLGLAEESACSIEQRRKLDLGAP